MQWLMAIAALVCAVPCVAASVSVIDDVGRTVTLPAPAARIVALSPHVTELLFAAGAGERVVGVTGFSDYPPPAALLPKIGDGAGLDMEAILALQPDLIVAWKSGNSPAQLERLERLGLPVFYSEPATLDAIASDMESLGALAGTAVPARQAAHRFRRGVDALRQRYAGRAPVRAFYQIWDRPLMTVNGEHLISAWLRVCGAQNIFSSLPALAPAVDVEAVIAADPQVIIAGGYPGKAVDWKVAWQKWSGVQAVAAGHLFTVPADLLERQTPRALQGARELCARIDRVRR